MSTKYVSIPFLVMNTKNLHAYMQTWHNFLNVFKQNAVAAAAAAPYPVSGQYATTGYEAYPYSSAAAAAAAGMSNIT